jgi:hypothetical protein
MVCFIGVLQSLQTRLMLACFSDVVVLVAQKNMQSNFKKILFFTSDSADYLANSLLHGFKCVPGVTVLDYPKAEIMYRGSEATRSVRGNGFTLYGLLEDTPIDRFDILDKLRGSFFDLVVFSSIHRQFGLFLQYYPFLPKERTLIFDGEDSPAIFPYQGQYFRKILYWFLPRVHKRFPYYKREWTPDTLGYIGYRLLPKLLYRYLPVPKKLRRISFSIPKEKIISEAPRKIKDFPRHIVDPEVSVHFPDASATSLFDSETEYYKDLQSSRFGITTKRSGWDCLRHYEIAANGTVPCFRDLDKKPDTCAPHGLNTSNCISYSNYDDLMRQVQCLDAKAYSELQSGALAWAKENTTLMRARMLLRACL